jgi:surfeit locus 1 family protein
VAASGLRTLNGVPSPLAPRYWGMHLLAVVLVGAAVALGAWQYDAWQLHRDAAAVDLTHKKPQPLTDVIGRDDPFPGNKVGQPVTVRGTWVPDGTVYVSGREHDGRDGYWVVTPVAVEGADGSAFPVVRGWVDDPDDAPAPPTGAASLTALLQPPEGTGAVDQDPDDDVLPQLRIGDLIQRVDQDLFGAYGVAVQPEGGLVKASLAQLPDAGTFTAIRNLFYAIEWWFFGLFAVFIWWRWVTETTAEGQAVEDAADVPTPGP